MSLEGIQFQPMPPVDESTKEKYDAFADPENGNEFRLTMAEAKQGLAKTFGVSPEAIEITIRG